MAHNATSGCAHFFAATEKECYDQVRRVMSFLPSNNMEEAPFKETGDDPSRTDMALREVVPTNPNKGYDVRDVIKKVVDNADFCEVQELYAKNIVTGFARVGGRVIGIIANQAKFMASSPEYTVMPVSRISHAPRLRSPTASFIAMTSGWSASLSYVSSAICTPVRPGMSYNMTGRHVAPRIARKWATTPGCVGFE